MKINACSVLFGCKNSICEWVHSKEPRAKDASLSHAGINKDSSIEVKIYFTQSRLYYCVEEIKTIEKQNKKTNFQLVFCFEN